MRALPAPELPAALEARVRRAIRRRPVPAAVRWLPLAAGLALAVLWGRGAAPFVAWELARDHRPLLRAGEACRPRSGPPRRGEIAEWYRQRRHGAAACSPPPRPESSWWAAASARCSTGRSLTFTTRAKSVIFPCSWSRDRRVSRPPTRTAGENVRLLHTSGVTLALVGEDMETVDAFNRALSMSRADAGGGGCDG